jgi:hypothetical protein
MNEEQDSQNENHYYESCSMPDEDRLSCSVDGCSVRQTGVCAVHNLEVERRKGLDIRMSDIKNLVEEMNSTVRTLVEHQAGLSGAFSSVCKIATLIIIGAFTYITLVWQSGEKEREALQSAVSANMKTVQSLTIEAEHSREFQNRTLKKMDKLNDTLTEWVALQKVHEERTKHIIHNWDTDTSP